MIIFGWGKRTKKVIGRLMVRSCSHCNVISNWELCLVRTWFTLFFIPIIPYSKKYCVACSNCGSYIELTQEDFLKYKESLAIGNTSGEVPDSIKYSGKTETQINFLKEMERVNNKKKD